MLLTIAPFGEFTQLFQVLSLIILPVMAFSMLVAVLLHYGRKRKKKDIPVDGNQHTYIAGSSPENFCYKTNDGQFIYLDHTGLLKEYRRKLSYSHARYAALQQDYRKLESGIHRFPSNHFKTTTMEYAEVQTQHWEENSIRETPFLESSPREEGYLADLLAEKKKQIEFLQNQIDLRIKSYHYAEKEKEEIRMQLEEAEQVHHRTVEEFESYKKTGWQSQQELEELRTSMEDKTKRLSETEQLLNTKQDQLLYMENVLQEVKTQNQLLNAAAADAEDKNKMLQQQVQEEAARIIVMEEKLMANKRLLQRLYNEFSACLQEETEEPPVIALRPDYINNEWEETVAQ